MKRLVILSILICWCALARAGETAHAETGTILVFGDSISAGFGLPQADHQGWVALLRAKLDKEGYDYEVVNASVTGETTSGGLARLPRALGVHHPAIVILELGGNDGLRALPIVQMRGNLDKMIEISHSAGAQVLLLGMRIPPNYGPQYTEQFASTYTDLARDKKLPLVPFLLNDIALTPALMQADGIHPNEIGQPKIFDNVWPTLKPLLHK